VYIVYSGLSSRTVRAAPSGTKRVSSDYDVIKIINLYNTSII